MLLEQSSDQEFFRETTSRYLSEKAPVAALRGLRHDPVGFESTYWRGGAELGWTSLLVSEQWGGGSISGRPLVDLSLVAHEFGWHTAPGPLLPCNLVAAALSGASSHTDVIGGLLDGSVIAAWCHQETGRSGRFGDLSTRATLDGSAIVIDGVKRPIEAAITATHFLVSCEIDGSPSLMLVPAGTDGVSVRALESVDLTRRFAEVRFDQVRVPLDAVVGELGGASGQIDSLVQTALALMAGESVGAMQRAFDITVEWAFDRFSFGRPLASYQALKHRFADMKSWLEASHAVADAAVDALDEGSAEAPEFVLAAAAYIGEYGSRLIQDCVQIHGGIGVTFEHDLHLFLRRHTINRTLLGTPSEHRQRLARLNLSSIAEAS